MNHSATVKYDVNTRNMFILDILVCPRCELNKIGKSPSTKNNSMKNQKQFSYK